MPLALLARLAAFVIGAYVVYATLLSAFRTFLLPRAAPDPITRAVFSVLRQLFDWRIRVMHTYVERDGLMAYYGPLGILMLLVAWLILILLGYTLLYWALGVESPDLDRWMAALTVSGSSLFTLGSATVNATAPKLLTFSEAAIGPILIALLIGYMPTIYGAFSKREALVNLLEVRAGSPPAATDLIIRFTRLHRPERIGEMWVQWEAWFSELEETHTSLAMLNFFRSPNPEHSWVTASGAVLDAAAMVLAAVDIPPNVQANLCIRAGYIALRRIADFFRLPYDPDPKPTDPISVTQKEFDEALKILEEEGVPLKSDRDQAWRDWAGWRVNYDAPLLALAKMTMAPPAPWSSPEMGEQRRPPRFGRGS
ncbi:MAG TPA: hypothetical protein VI547_09735 [Anaerolineales bacterium]|nr:hypothetical protein [Anaerolineales bacterium]HLF02244.1 hypothetical protein [Anaerolineales bacterium]